MNIRYDPDLPKSELEEVLIYDGDQYLGTEGKVHFSDNAVMKHRGRGKNQDLESLIRTLLGK